jgi:hypothetical protein
MKSLPMHNLAIAATGSFLAFATLISLADHYPTIAVRPIGPEAPGRVADAMPSETPEHYHDAGSRSARSVFEALQLQPASFSPGDPDEDRALIARAGFGSLAGLAGILGRAAGGDSQPDGTRGATLLENLRRFRGGGIAAEPRAGAFTKIDVKMATPRRRHRRTFDAQARCLAQAVYFEGRGESKKGQAAIAEVILNRVESDGYPDSICGVVFEGSRQRHKCQFSFACDGKSDRPEEKDAWLAAKQIAMTVITKKTRSLTGSATHYHASYVKPSWTRAMKRTIRIGRHIFYRKKHG